MTPGRLFMFALIILFSEAPFQAQADENLIHNGGFEERTTEPWREAARFWTRSPAARMVEANAFEGRRCLVITLKTPGTAAVIQRVSVLPLTLYRITARIKTVGLTAQGPGAHIFIPSLNAVSNDFSGTTGEWREAVLFIKTDALQTELEIGARVGADGLPARGEALFDEFIMTQTARAVPTPVKQGIFGFPTGLLIFSIAAALLLALFARLCLKKGASLNGHLLDLILIGGLTIVYAFIAFWNLGSFDTPQTYYTATQKNEGFSIDLGESVPIGKLLYFLALGKGAFDLDFSDDGKVWKERQTIAQENIYSMIEWRTLAVGVSARYIRVTAVNPDVMLGEIGVFRRDNGAQAPAHGIIAAPGRLSPKDDPGAVCDEPGRVPSTPSYLNSMYFDETYHARAAFEYVLGRDSSETTHPPLGKLTIALGILAAGFTPFGWRLMGTLCGVLMVPLMYAFGIALFKKREYAFAAAFLFAFDFMHFVQTRIATIDVYGVFWIICMYYFMYRAVRLNPFGRKPWKYYGFLLLSGLSFGLGAASKWIAFYGAIGLAVILFATFIYRLIIFIIEYLGLQLNARTENRIEDEKPTSRFTLKRFVDRLIGTPLITAALSVVFFIVLPALIYVASYLPFLAVRGPQQPYRTSLDLIMDEQRFMYNYHATLCATHPFSSPWYEWPIMAKPIWYYSGKPDVPDNLTSSIAAFGNPAVWWLGSAAAVALAGLLAAALVNIVRQYRAKAEPVDDDPGRTIFPTLGQYVKKYAQALFILVALAAQYLPWIFIPRKLTFIYHFFASVPFLVFCIVWFLKFFREKYPTVFNKIFIIYLALVLVLFILFSPILSGLPVPTMFVQGILKWFDGWHFY